MGFMAAYRNLQQHFNQGKLNPAVPGALSVLRHIHEEFVKVLNDSTARKHRAEGAEDKELLARQDELLDILGKVPTSQADLSVNGKALCGVGT